MRHAQAESFAASDLERPLTTAGQADADSLGRWLATHDIAPEEAWVSAALRTRETWAALAGAANWNVEPVTDGHLYGTDEQGVLEVVRITDETVGTVIVVGHNPTMEMLVHLLDDGEGVTGDDSPFAGFPTASAAVFEITTEWSGIGAMTGRLTHFHVARA